MSYIVQQTRRQTALQWFLMMPAVLGGGKGMDICNWPNRELGVLKDAVSWKKTFKEAYILCSLCYEQNTRVLAVTLWDLAGS